MSLFFTMLLSQFLFSCSGAKVDDGSSTFNSDSGASTDTCIQNWWPDGDGDGYGYGDETNSIVACEEPEGTATNRQDCDDTHASVYPRAEEICGDDLVNDCLDGDGAVAHDACDHLDVSVADARLFGEEPADEAGYVVAGVGDVNGDGNDDLVVTALRHVPGVAYVVSGPVVGAYSLSGSDAQVLGDSGGEDGFGIAAAQARDVDADGYADLLLGAFHGPTAYLVLGPAVGTMNSADADARILGEDDDQTGRALAGPGDVDGDDTPDLMVAAPSAQGSTRESDAGYCASEEESSAPHGLFAGQVSLFSGSVTGDVDRSSAEANLIGEDGGDVAGSSVAAPGDLNGDGLADLLLSAPGNCEGGSSAGAVYMVLSPVSGDLDLADADAKLVGTADYAAIGQAVSGAGDTNGDGTPDLLVSDPDKAVDTDVGDGAVYLFLGAPSSRWRLTDAEAVFYGRDRAHAGESLAAAGDVNADGFDDIVIGAWGFDDDGAGSGAAFVVYGPLSGTHDLLNDADTTVAGDAAEYFGYSVAGAGDVDADGQPDLIVGAIISGGGDDGGVGPGAAYLLLGGGALLANPPGI